MFSVCELYVKKTFFGGHGGHEGGLKLLCVSVYILSAIFLTDCILFQPSAREIPLNSCRLRHTPLSFFRR